jgi:hypothetical protein
VETNYRRKITPSFVKSILSLYLSLLLPYSADGQSADSTAAERPRTRNFSSYNSRSKADGTFPHLPGTQKRYVGKDNIIFATYNLQMSSFEDEITDLEDLECTAILKRDTAVLKALWSRDFTLDEPSSELVNSQNTLPYYASFIRMVEKFTAMDINTVYTSGYELVQPLKPNGGVDDPVKRNYFHAWIRTNGVWKLSTKTHDN